MSKTSVVKKHIGHTKEAPKCGNCKHYSFVVETKKSRYGEVTKMRNKRCTLHGIATSAACYCIDHSRGVPTKVETTV